MIQTFIIKEGEFPHRRKASCCDLQTVAGESVIVLPIKLGGVPKSKMVLHVRCLKAVCADLPPDASDSISQYEALREQMMKTGRLGKRKRARRRGEVVASAR